MRKKLMVGSDCSGSNPVCKQRGRTRSDKWLIIVIGWNRVPPFSSTIDTRRNDLARACVYPLRVFIIFVSKHSLYGQGIRIGPMRLKRINRINVASLA